jgi:hypothetical protein
MRYLGPAFFDEAPIILCIFLRGQQPGFGVRFVVKEDNAGIGNSEVLEREQQGLTNPPVPDGESEHAHADRGQDQPLRCAIRQTDTRPTPPDTPQLPLNPLRTEDREQVGDTEGAGRHWSRVSAAKRKEIDTYDTDFPIHDAMQQHPSQHRDNE